MDGGLKLLTIKNSKLRSFTYGLGMDSLQECVQWRVLVTTLTNMCVPYKAGNFLTS